MEIFYYRHFLGTFCFQEYLKTGKYYVCMVLFFWKINMRQNAEIYFNEVNKEHISEIVCLITYKICIPEDISFSKIITE